MLLAALPGRRWRRWSSALTIRRGLAVAAVIVVLLVSYTVVSTIQGISFDTGHETVGEVAGLFSPYTLVNGVQVFLFDSPEATPTPPTGDGDGLALPRRDARSWSLGSVGAMLARYRKVAARQLRSRPGRMSTSGSTTSRGGTATSSRSTTSR